jgi:hypothetical protein
MTKMALSFPSLYELLPTYSAVDIGGTRKPLRDEGTRADVLGLCPVEVKDLDARVQRGLSLHADLVKDLPVGGPTKYELVCLRGSDHPTPFLTSLAHQKLKTVEDVDGVRHGGDGVVPTDSGLPSFWTETSRGKPAGGKHSTMAGGKGVLEELRVTLRHTGRLQAETVPVAVTMPTEAVAGQEISVEYEAVPDGDGWRAPLNLALEIDPVESTSARQTCPSVRKGDSYRTRPAVLTPGLYRLRLVKAHPAARAIEKLEDWLVVYDDMASDP